MCWSKRRGIELLRNIPTSEASWSEQDRSLGFLRARFKRDKTYDNRTREVLCEVRPLSLGLPGKHVPHIFSFILWVTSREDEANIPILLVGSPKVPEGENLLLEEVG